MVYFLLSGVSACGFISLWIFIYFCAGVLERFLGGGYFYFYLFGVDIWVFNFLVLKGLVVFSFFFDRLRN